MATTPTPSLPAEQQKPVITEKQKAFAATNNPDLSELSFTLTENRNTKDGSKPKEYTFKVVHLDYDSYLIFLSKLEPILKMIASKVSQARGVSIPGIDLYSEQVDAKKLPSLMMQYCKSDLPEMVAIICNMTTEQTNIKADAKWVKEHSKNPFELLNIVMLQVAQNKMISDFSAFFGQLIPLLTPEQNQTEPTESMTEETLTS